MKALSRPVAAPGVTRGTLLWVSPSTEVTSGVPMPWVGLDLHKRYIMRARWMTLGRGC
jgi:hypothetical protein